MRLLLSVHVLPAGAADNTCKQRETVQPDIPFVFGPTVHYSTAPPSLKSIFIFAVLTFSSSSQRHNDWLPAAAATCIQCEQTQHGARSGAIVHQLPLLYSSQRKLLSLFFFFPSVTEALMRVIAEALTFRLNVS